jgi:hypothetical protein
MAKRFVETCDWCKEEAELIASVTVQKDKKKAKRSYELCLKCASTMEERLVAATIPKASAHKTESVEDDDTITLDDGSTRRIPTRAELDSADAEIEDAPLVQDLPDADDEDGNRCVHMNRTPPRISKATQGKLMVKCEDCGQLLPYKSARQKHMELKGSLPNDIRMSDHPSEERKGR